MAAITVNNFAELRSAIMDATSTEIYLGDDITYATGGIEVPRTKGDITIDGGGIYTINDLASSSGYNAIYVRNVTGVPLSITFKNLTWNGRNFYGVLYVPETAAVGGNVTLVLDNVQYTGPQPIHNRYGITRVVNSAFTITQNGSPNAPQEFCEANRISIAGNVTVNSATSGTSVMWLCSPSSSLTVEPDAVFTVTAPSTYMWYTDSTPQPTMLFGENSVTNISTRDGSYYTSGSAVHIAQTVTLKAGASFTASQSNRNSVALLKCRENFTMEEGSSLFLVQPNSGTSPLMYFGATATLNFNNPKSVVLYNNGGAVFSFTAGTAASPNIMNVTTELFNLWTAAKTPYTSAGGFDDIPSHALSKVDYADITAEVRLTTSTTTTSAITTNIVAGDTGYPVTAANFNVAAARVISMGRLTLIPDIINDLADAVTGTADSAANIQATYEGLATPLSGTADAAGRYSLPLPARVPAGTIITEGANKWFLIKWKEIEVLGSVSITYKEDLIFRTFVAPYAHTEIRRKKADWYLEVTDTRLYDGPDWDLYLSLNRELTNGSGYTIEDGVNLREGSSDTTINQTPVYIRSGSWGSSPPTVTRVTWSQVEGFFLGLIANYPYNAGTYTADMQWELRESP